MLNIKEKTLKSKNLTFRLLNNEDKKDLYEILQEPETTLPVGKLPIKDQESFKVYWYNLTKDNSAISILLNGNCIGYYHFYKYIIDNPIHKDMNNVGIGFLIGKDYLHRGYGTEALLILNAYLLTIFDNIFADYFIENIASKKTLEKCGFKYLETYKMEFDELKETKLIASNVLSK